MRKSKADMDNSSGNEAPAYFSSITLENIKCFKDKQTLNLCDEKGKPFQWTIILGDNGTGKTTLLQCLSNSTPVNENDLAFKTLRFSLFDRNRTPNDFQSVNLSRNSQDDSLIETSVTYGSKLSEKKPDFKTVKIPIPFSKSLTTVTPLSKKKHNYELLCFGYGASRRMSTPTLIEKASSQPDASLFSDDAILTNAEEWLLQLDYSASKKSAFQKKAEKQRDKVKNILLSLLPEEVKEIIFTEPSYESFKPEIKFITDYGKVSMKDLSLGYRTMITWSVDLTSRLFDRYKDSEHPEREPAVVLIDEIDLHLHPKWQRRIIDFLSKTFINTQFIVTAHSPLIVQAAAEENLILLKKEGDHVVIDSHHPNIKGWRVDQVLISDLFGLPGSREQGLDTLIEEREKILSKPELSAKDKKRIKELEKNLDDLPYGDTLEDIEAMTIIREAAKHLKNNREKVE